MHGSAVRKFGIRRSAGAILALSADSGKIRMETNKVEVAARAASVADTAETHDSSTWQIRIGSFLVPVAHAAGQNVVMVLGLRFLTDSLAISAGVAGLMFALIKIYDGLTDPIIGAWSDLSDTRWGRRLPFLLAGGLAMPLGLAMMFGAPDFGSILMAQAFVMLALIIHSTGYTLLTIPGFAMVVEASSDHKERTRLMSWRVYGNAVGTLLGTTMPAWILSRMGTDRSDHLVMALAVGGVVFLSTMMAVKLLAKAPRTKPNKDQTRGYSIISQARMAWANRPFRTLAFAHFFLLFGTAIGTGSLAYFSRYVLQAGDGALGTFFLVATIGMVGSMPIWVRVSDKFTKKWAYIAAMTLFGLLNLSWLLAQAGESMILIGVRGLFAGFAGGGMILCAYALLSDAVRYDFVRNGERREGAFAGFTTLLDKMSSAVAPAIMGVFLSAMGYVSSTDGGAIEQGAGALLAIRICVAVLPALAMVAAILVMSRYDLDPAKHIEPEETAA
jgi:glycoside/pentoside/hexuronide:cation symporter, GPH family